MDFPKIALALISKYGKLNRTQKRFSGWVWSFLEELGMNRCCDSCPLRFHASFTPCVFNAVTVVGGCGGVDV